MIAPREQLDRMFETSDDPWGFRTRWYEARKRDLTLACLPERRYASAYEPGCANGELVAALATRCDRVLASDGIDTAVVLARKRVADCPNVEIVQAWVPQDWPTETFDLIVISELGYYLEPKMFEALTERAAQSLSAKGTLLACHWRHPIEGCTMDGAAVHRILEAGLGMTRLVQHDERDFTIAVWSRDGRSVGEREGLY